LALGRWAKTICLKATSNASDFMRTSWAERHINKEIFFVSALEEGVKFVLHLITEYIRINYFLHVNTNYHNNINQ